MKRMQWKKSGRNRKKGPRDPPVLNRRSSLAQEMGRIKKQLGREVYDPSRRPGFSPPWPGQRGPLPDEPWATLPEIFSPPGSCSLPLPSPAWGRRLLFPIWPLWTNSEKFPNRAGENHRSVFDGLEKERHLLASFPSKIPSRIGQDDSRPDDLHPLKVRPRPPEGFPLPNVQRKEGKSRKSIPTPKPWPNAGMAGRNLPMPSGATDSTATAALRSRRTRGGCHLASSLASKVYGLNLLPRIEDHPVNITRFLVLGITGKAAPRAGTRLRFFSAPLMSREPFTDLGPFAEQD